MKDFKEIRQEQQEIEKEVKSLILEYGFVINDEQACILVNAIRKSILKNS